MHDFHAEARQPALPAPPHPLMRVAAATSAPPRRPGCTRLYFPQQKRLLRQRLVCCVAQGAQADVLLSRLHLCLPGWRAAEGRRRRAEQHVEWQEAARARGLEWDERGTDSSDFDEPQGAHRRH